MYKVLLVDDESLIREAISESIDWNALGYELNGTCANGKQAIEAMKKDTPDVILTDICMPYVDGLELAKYVWENYRDQVKVVIISGYDNFEYARQAIKYQVMEYVLKPITASELSETLKKLREKLDIEGQEAIRADWVKEAYEKSRPLLKERLLNQLMRQSQVYKNIPEALKSHGICLEGENFLVARVRCRSGFQFVHEHVQPKDEIVFFAVYNVAEEMLREEENCVVFQDMESVTTIVLGGYSEYQLEERILRLCSPVQSFIFSRLRIATMIDVGRCVGNLDELEQSYANAREAGEYEFLFEENTVVFGKEFLNQGDKNKVDIERWTQRISAAIRKNAEDEIRLSIHQFTEELRHAYISKNRILSYAQSIVLKLMLEAGPGAEEKRAFEKEQEFLMSLNSYQKLESVEQAMCEFGVEIARVSKSNRENTAKHQAEKALRYIEENYRDSEISLNTVCRYLSMSTSYFSTVFKNCTGETFIEALTKKRMEKARELLESTAMKAYEVAEQVGYADPHYFGSTFKKYTGMTPTEYAKKRR